MQTKKSNGRGGCLLVTHFSTHRLERRPRSHRRGQTLVPVDRREILPPGRTPRPIEGAVPPVSPADEEGRSIRTARCPNTIRRHLAADLETGAQDVSELGAVLPIVSALLTTDPAARVPIPHRGDDRHKREGHHLDAGLCPESPPSFGRHRHAVAGRPPPWHFLKLIVMLDT
jgi:hypothetical protein